MQVSGAMSGVTGDPPAQPDTPKAADAVQVAGHPSARETIMMMPRHAQLPPTRRQPAGKASDLLPLGDWIRHHSPC